MGDSTNESRNISMIHKMKLKSLDGIVRKPRLTLTQYMLFSIATVTLVLSNYWLIQDFNTIYHAFFILFVALCFIEKSALRALRSYAGYWMFAFAFVLALMALAGHGDRISYSFISFMKNIPFFMLGFALANKQYWFRRWMLLSIIAVYAAFAVKYLISILIWGGRFATRQAVASIFSENADAVVSAFISYFPTQVLVMFFCITLLNDSQQRFKVFGIVCGCILSMLVIFSYWVMPIFMIAIGGSVLVLQTIKKTKLSFKQRLYTIILVACAVFIVIPILNALAARGAVGQRVIDRTMGVLGVPFSSGGIGEIDSFSGGRLSLAAESIAVFSKRPILGNGDYYFRGTGGHSLWFDSLARYGLLGSIPIFAFGITILVISTRNFNSKRSDYTDTAMMMAIYSWFFASFMNPYLLGTVGYFVFLAGGMATGRYKMLQHNGIPS